jgi:cytochrome c oxidase subunit II
MTNWSGFGKLSTIENLACKSLKRKHYKMANSNPKKRRVLIASSHPLFGQGLRSLLNKRQETGVEVVGMVSNLGEAISALERLNPDLIIVDYDDVNLNRDEFLARFVEGEQKLRVVLLSLQSAGNAIVYDRRTLAASQIDDWLDEWTYADEVQVHPTGSFTAALGADQNVHKGRTDMKHLVAAGFLVLVITALLIVGLNNVQLLPDQASAQALPIDSLFYKEFVVIAFLFSLIVVFMVYSMFVFRRKPGDTTDGPHMEGNTRLEVLWTIAPLMTVLYFAYLGGQSLADTVRADPQALEIKVVGQQWSWRFEYPDYGIVSTDLMMPLNKQALLRLSSTDVIHSFWVPEFRVKQDALPGGSEFVRDLRITPTEIGEYTVRCAELCGLQHAYMNAPVKVVSQQGFDAWVAEQTTQAGTPEERGARLAQQYGCLACHSIDGTTLVGPTWQGVFGHEVTLVDGSTVLVDEAYLRESIIDPSAKIVQGFQDLMPKNFAEQLTDDQISDLIEYIKTIQ